MCVITTVLLELCSHCSSGSPRCRHGHGPFAGSNAYGKNKEGSRIGQGEPSDHGTDLSEVSSSTVDLQANLSVGEIELKWQGP